MWQTETQKPPGQSTGREKSKVHRATDRSPGNGKGGDRTAGKGQGKSKKGKDVQQQARPRPHGLQAGYRKKARAV